MVTLCCFWRTEPVYLWNDLIICFWSIQQLSQSFLASVPVPIAAMKFISLFLQRSLKLVRPDIKFAFSVLFLIKYTSKWISKLSLSVCFFYIFTQCARFFVFKVVREVEIQLKKTNNNLNEQSLHAGANIWLREEGTGSFHPQNAMQHPEPLVQQVRRVSLQVVHMFTCHNLNKNNNSKHMRTVRRTKPIPMFNLCIL